MRLGESSMIDPSRGRPRRGLSLPSLPVIVLLSLLVVSTVAAQLPPRRHEPSSPQRILRNVQAQDFEPPSPVWHSTPSGQEPIKEKPVSIQNALAALLEAIDIMQSHHFELWQGTWPRAIDWTAAVLGTQVSATLRTLTSTFRHFSPFPSDLLALENIINRYFLQTSAFYFGENAFSLRNQAYDDMLWVVLGWLENIKLINLHSRLHYAQDSVSDSSAMNISANWHGEQFIPAAAHRARVFYEIAFQGWDTVLCGGGMTWNPDLTPYKNAITNELYIAASVSMYLYFPGDGNTSPFSVSSSQNSKSRIQDLDPAEPHNPSYLANAIDGYKWLRASNMTNTRGLYVDGFHIKGWQRGISNGTGKCDERNEMVYTYNQGVLLTGLRGLWIATGVRSYLYDAHNLITSVIAATGWGYHDGQWRGLGRDGVMEEECDHRGICSQNGHTFKGIFFHHLAEFCRPPDPNEGKFLADVAGGEDVEAVAWHGRECSRYYTWVSHNANAAYVTRNEQGDMGMWWGRAYPSPVDAFDIQNTNDDASTSNTVDYRNAGVPGNDTLWVFGKAVKAGDENAGIPAGSEQVHVNDEIVEDVNDRGRGRTVETQSGGVAALRAYLEWTVGHVR
jgi:hypothetical protein